MRLDIRSTEQKQHDRGECSLLYKEARTTLRTNIACLKTVTSIDVFSYFIRARIWSKKVILAYTNLQLHEWERAKIFYLDGLSCVIRIVYYWKFSVQLFFWNLINYWLVTTGLEFDFFIMMYYCIYQFQTYI